MTYFAARWSAAVGSLFLTLLAGSAHAQLQWGLEFSTAVPVVVAGDTLRNAWAGGFNSAAFGQMDFNGDAIPDLFVWDASTHRPLTFVAQNGQWQHQHAYEAAFPASARAGFLALLRDYDGDGRPDLWASENQFVQLYRNETTTSGLGFRFVPVGGYLQSALPGDPPTELEADPFSTFDVVDVDADGDLDLLAYDYGTSDITLHRNTAGPGAAPVFQQENRWGNMTWCGAQQYAFQGSSCRPAAPQHLIPAHTLFAADLDQDRDIDLLLGHEYITELALLTNQGTVGQERFTDTSPTVPFLAGSAHPARVPHVPAAFQADVNFDGRLDLLLSPWSVRQPGQVEDVFDARRSANLFTNTSTGLAFQEPDFLQNQMLEVGEYAAPALGDLDGDGDLDLLVGSMADYLADPAGGVRPLAYRSRMRFYRNVGSPQRAIFELADEDYASLTGLDKRAFVPALADLDADGDLDLVLRYSDDAVGTANRALAYILNVAPRGQAAQFPSSTLTTFDFQIGSGRRGSRDVPCFYDVDGDGRTDMLLGTDQPAGGASQMLQFVRNQSNPPNTGFQTANPDFGRLSTTVGGLPGLAPTVLDLDGDGRPELLTLADDGELRLWPQVLVSPTVPTPAVDHLLRNDLTQAFGSSSFGPRPVITSGDLDGDGRAEVLIGTAGGGIRLLRSQPNGLTGIPTISPPTTGPALAVWPNPAAVGTSLTVRLPSINRSETLASLALFDQLGRLVRRWPAASGATSVSLTDLIPGAYVLRAVTASSQPLTVRVVLTP
jgi:FG-GAP-like repeat